MNTDLTRTLGIDVPIIQAPMGGAVGPRLAAAVCNAGGLGTLPLSAADIDHLRQQLRELRALTSRPFAVNLNASKPQEERLAACLDEGVPAISFFWGQSAALIAQARAGGATVLQTVGSAAEARAAVDLGADIVVAQGWEAGGHVGGDVATMALVPAVVDAVHPVPVVAAGSIADGRGMAAALALGVTGAGLASAIVAFALLTGFAIFTALDPELRGLRLLQLPSRPIIGDVREIFRYGLPVGVFTLGEVGLFLIATVVVSLFGTEALAAHPVALRLAGIVYAIPAGLSQAATVRVGTAIGRGEEANVKCAVGTARTVGMASGIGICTGLVAGSGVIPALFVTPGGAVAATASTLLLLLGLLHLAQGLAGPATAILRAFKDTKRPMQLSLAGYWMVGMPVGALLGFGLNLGVFGIWCGLGVGVLASAVLLNARLFRSILRPHQAAHFLENEEIQAAA